jgi:putative endonuclease
MKQFTSKTQIIGETGEKIALKFLKDKGFTILERNYTKKIGEIDIVAQRGETLHFVEVKSLIKYVPRETYNPFENLSHFKLRKITRTIQWYLIERHVSRETPWVIDAIAVIIDRNSRSAKVEVMWNIIK